MKFTIDCRKWRRNNGIQTIDKDGHIDLLNDKGMSCCLGLCALQMGATEENIRHINEPATITYQGWDKDKILSYECGNCQRHTSLSIRAMEINDSDRSDDKEKIEELIELFKCNGHEVEFINKPEGC